MAESDQSFSEPLNKRPLELAMKAWYSLPRQRTLTVFQASVCVIVKFVCAPADRSMRQTLSFSVCECVLAYWTIVGKQSEDPRSCWREMIGFGTCWPLSDRWLGAGLAQPKSPTHTYVGLYNVDSHSLAHTQTFGKRKFRQAMPSMEKSLKGEFVIFIYTFI